jgi:hypothetical protein
MIIKFLPFMEDNCIPNVISLKILSQFLARSKAAAAEKNDLINEFLGGNNNVNIAKQQSSGIN